MGMLHQPAPLARDPRIHLGRHPIGVDRRFIELDPVDPFRRERVQDVQVRVHELGQPVQRLARRSRGRLRQRQERHGTDQHGTGGDVVATRPAHLRDQERRIRGEPARGIQLGHEMVVVRVEPLGHLQRRNALRTAGRGEVAVQPRRQQLRGGGVVAGRGCRPVVGDAVDSGGQGTDHCGDVEHLVVKGKGADGHRIQAGRRRALQAAVDEGGGGLRELRRQGRIAPVGLDGLLQFPMGADAGESRHRRDEGRARARRGRMCGHGVIASILVKKDRGRPRTARRGIADGRRACATSPKRRPRPSGLPRRACPRAPSVSRIG